MLKYSDIYDLCEPVTIVIFNESLHTFAYILPVGQCTPYTNVMQRKCRYASSVGSEPNNLMAYISKPLSQKLDLQFISNILYLNFLGSCINYKYKNSSEQRNDVMKKIKMFYFNGGTLPSTGMWQGEVFAISDCLVVNSFWGFEARRSMLIFACVRWICKERQYVGCMDIQFVFMKMFIYKWLCNLQLRQCIKGGLDGGGGGSRIRYSIKNSVLIRDSISEISP